MTCDICCYRDSNYKCPNCRISYCSVKCWNKHKESPCKPVLQEQPKVVNEKPYNYKYETEDTVPLERLRMLEKSSALQQILRNQRLCEMLKSIDSSPDPARAMQLAMQEPLFVEYADECLKIVEPLEKA